MRLALALLLAASAASAKTFYLTVAGLGGEIEYETRFDGLATESDKALRAPGGDVEVITLKGADATRARFRASLEQISRSATAKDLLVLLLIGHGTFDGTDYKFNVPGPDITAREMADALNKVSASRQVVVNTTSSSGAALKPLQHNGRVIVSATRDGSEKNATVFARFWIEALHNNSADTDKNDVVTVSEAFQFARARTAKFYEEQKRIATEHPVLDDGAHAASFALVRFGAAAVAAADPAKKQLMTRRDDVEARIDSLKLQKSTLPPEEYRKQLTALLLELAKTQQEIDK